jgi:hypothetical protein
MSKPTLAVYKFSSCDGCQLSLLNLEDELLDLAGVVEIAYFLEARRRTLPAPYDIALVEGSVSTPHEVERIKEILSGPAQPQAASRPYAISPTWMIWLWQCMNTRNTCMHCLPQPRFLSTSG